MGLRRGPRAGGRAPVGQPPSITLGRVEGTADPGLDEGDPDPAWPPISSGTR